MAGVSTYVNGTRSDELLHTVNSASRGTIGKVSESVGLVATRYARHGSSRAWIRFAKMRQLSHSDASMSASESWSVWIAALQNWSSPQLNWIN